MKSFTRTLVAAAAVSGVAISFGVGAASAKIYKLTAGSSHPPIVPWVAVIKNHVVPQSVARGKAAGKGDSIKWTQAYAGALYNFQNTLEGVQKGSADIGWVGTLWEPIKMPLMNVSFYAPFATGNVETLTNIGHQLHQDIPAMNKAWDKHNQVYLGIQVADTYNTFTTFPLKSVADLKGKKIYGPGAVAEWLRGTGAVAVNGTSRHDRPHVSFNRVRWHGGRVVQRRWRFGFGCCGRSTDLERIRSGKWRAGRFKLCTSELLPRDCGREY